MNFLSFSLIQLTFVKGEMSIVHFSEIFVFVTCPNFYSHEGRDEYMLVNFLSLSVIRCSKNSSKFKFVGSVWNMNERVVLVILNPSQLTSREIDFVCS